MGNRSDNGTPAATPAQAPVPAQRRQPAGDDPPPDGEIPRPEFVSLTYTLPYHLVEQVDELARATNRARSEILAESIRLYLKAWATRQQSTRISTVDGFSYQEVTIADAVVHDTPRVAEGNPPSGIEGDGNAVIDSDAPQAARTEAVAVTSTGTGTGRESDTVVEVEVEAESNCAASPRADDTSPRADDASPRADDAGDTASPGADGPGDADRLAADDADSTPLAGDEDAAGPAVDEAEAVPETDRSAETPSTVTPFPGDDPAADVRRRLAEIADEDLDSEQLLRCLQQVMQQVDRKDFSPPEHSTKVAELARQLAHAKGFRGSRLQEIHLAGLVHDIGKACVPDEVIKKPKPSPEEMALIRRYPEFGVELLSEVPAMRPVLPVVAAHQERWNGSGYPNGTQRGAIPVAAQIVALCDVYDVLNTARRYRPAYSEERARQIIQQNAGTLWNPEIAKLFLTRIVNDAKQARAGARR